MNVPPSVEVIAQELFDNDVICQIAARTARSRGETIDPIAFLGLTEDEVGE